MKVGFVGWRGMVGSVLLDRMVQEEDFKNFEAKFFSTSEPGQLFNRKIKFVRDTILLDAFDVECLSECDVILTCQGSSYTSAIHPKLRKSGWNGFWIDAAKTLRMDDDSTLVLDPVNHLAIEMALNNGVKNFVGSNCTVSCLLMAIGALFKEGLIDWVSSSTYQAASGGGAGHILELLKQMGAIHQSVESDLKTLTNTILEIDKKVLDQQNKFSDDEISCFQVPLAGNLIPWIDHDMENGISLEEWKGHAEINKILGKNHLDKLNSIPVDFSCVRVGTMRCHSQSLIIKLNKDISLNEVEGLIQSANKWVNLVANTREETIHNLTPMSVAGTLTIGVGRLRKLSFGSDYLGAFTIGDQLLWGAAEPLRRALKYLI
ncbi:MAG: aspartate-semialdehyde dehydrogenase [Betaproteobacteria bacterium TMED41]|nr:MAG: aspartate-semialdehyde dehydrogenase [Betaproteobacteria bacterium TMED41]